MRWPSVKRSASPTDRARKRFARRQWARRWLTWRYLLAGTLVVALVALGIYAVYFSPWLRAEKVQVAGVSQLSESQVLGAADVATGGPLARVDLSAIETRVRNLLPAVETVDVTRVWPHEVRIQVVERTPVAVVSNAGGELLVDAEGHHFPPTKRSPTDLPRIVQGTQADEQAVSEAAAVVAALDESVATLVDYIEVATRDQIRLQLRDGRVVEWGSAEQSEEKAEVLLALLKVEARVYDVSVPALPTTR